MRQQLFWFVFITLSHYWILPNFSSRFFSSWSSFSDNLPNMERKKPMSWSFWARVSCISWNLKNYKVYFICIWIYKYQHLNKRGLPVISLLQKLLQTLKFTHFKVGFVCVLVSYESTAVTERRQVRAAASGRWRDGKPDLGWPWSSAQTHPYLEWGHLMCSHSFRWASRFMVSRGGQEGLLGQRTGL